MSPVISEGEALALGLSTVVHNGQSVEGYSVEMLDAMAAGDPFQADGEGRPYITYRQYEELSARGTRMEGFAMKMTHPSKPGQWWPIQASKYLKWYGLGYRPLGGETPKAAKETPARPAPKAEATADAPMVYFCSEKYPDCKRFFDTQKGLAFHWRKDHGEAAIKRPKKASE